MESYEDIYIYISYGIHNFISDDGDQSGGNVAHVAHN